MLAFRNLGLLPNRAKREFPGKHSFMSQKPLYISEPFWRLFFLRSFFFLSKLGLASILASILSFIFVSLNPFLFRSFFRWFSSIFFFFFFSTVCPLPAAAFHPEKILVHESKIPKTNRSSFLVKHRAFRVLVGIILSIDLGVVFWRFLDQTTAFSNIPFTSSDSWLELLSRVSLWFVFFCVFL